jgi:hypothetical protein
MHQMERIRTRLARRARDVLGITGIEEHLERIDRALVDPNQPPVAAIQRIEHLTNLANTGGHPRRFRGPDQALQNLLLLHYRDLIDAGRPLPAFGDIEMRFYSQNGEDGIILLLVAAVGTDTKRSVEICAGDGIECNTANLLLNQGWTGLLVDGGEELVTKGREFYEWGTEAFYYPPTLRQAWVTAENVNELVRDAGFDGVIDLLSIDLDGMDYWVWKALDCVQPRIVVIEINDAWGPYESVTVPYDPQFIWEKSSVYVGASLAAMCKLGAEKGYRLVGTQRYGLNAFFVRDDLACDTLPTAKPETCLGHPKVQRKKAKLDEVKDRAWVRV